MGDAGAVFWSYSFETQTKVMIGFTVIASVFAIGLLFRYINDLINERNKWRGLCMGYDYACAVAIISSTNRANVYSRLMDTQTLAYNISKENNERYFYTKQAIDDVLSNFTEDGDYSHPQLGKH